MMAWATLGLIYVEARYVRYASLTYLFAVAVLLDALWFGLTYPIRRWPAHLSRLVSLGLFGGVCIAGVWTYYPGMLALTSLAKSAALSPGLAQLSGQLEDSVFKEIGNWQISVPGAQIEVSPNGVWEVFTSEVAGYQAMARIDTQRTNSLTYRYELQAKGGPSYLGVLRGDGSLFRTQQLIEPGERVRDQVTTMLDDQFVYLVISTSAAAEGAKLVQLGSVRYALWCAGPTPRIQSSILLRLRYQLFPLPSDLGIAPCLREPLFEITPLADGAWQSIVAPAEVFGSEVKINAEPPSPGAYMTVSVPYWLPGGARIGAVGTVRRGGLVLGLLDAEGRWAVATAIPTGPFRVTVTTPVDGTYRIVLANNLPAGENVNEARVTEVGLVKDQSGQPGLIGNP
jgi:hypothetical protein